MSKRMATVSFDAQVRFHDRDGYWAAWIEPLGMAVYGDTAEEAAARVEPFLKFFVQSLGVERVRKYFDSHSVRTTVVHGESMAQRVYPVDVLAELMAHA